jgi:hypothetical protein
MLILNYLKFNQCSMNQLRLNYIIDDPCHRLHLIFFVIGKIASLLAQDRMNVRAFSMIASYSFKQII